MDRKSMFGLIIPSRDLKPKPPEPPQKRKNIFDEDSDSQDESSTDWVKESLKKQSHSSMQQKQSAQALKRAIADDPKVFQYDELYDDMERKREDSKSVAKKDRKPKYIEKLLKTAEVRQREYEEREERKVQKEREAEGDEFKDKEAFVTGAYRRKMEELERIKAEQKQKDALDDLTDVTKQKDLSGFYRHLYRQQVQKPEAETTNIVAESTNNDDDSSKPQESLPKDESSSSSEAETSELKAKSSKLEEKSPEPPKPRSSDRRQDHDKDKRHRESSRDHRSPNRDRRRNENRSPDRDRKYRERDRKDSPGRTRRYEDQDRLRDRHSSPTSRRHHDRDRRDYKSPDRDRRRRNDDYRYNDRRDRNADRDRTERHRDDNRRPRHRQESEERVTSSSSTTVRNRHGDRDKPKKADRDNADKERKHHKKSSEKPDKENLKEEEKPLPIPKRSSIWIKRTVGEVFDEALARYFARKQANSLQANVVVAD